MSMKKTLLVVEDSVVNQKILAKILLDEYQIIPAHDGEEGLRLLAQHADEISAVILDIVMPNLNGFEFLEAVGTQVMYRDLPIIVSTGNSREEHESRALELGAWDFIAKPYNEQILKLRLKNAMERSQRAAFHQLKYLAEYDTLTGIYNKSKFFDKTREMLKRNPDNQFVFVRFDIDRFQLINTFFGVQEGDRLLRYLAEKFKGYLSTVELHTYGRMEADIFVCCVKYTSRATVLAGLRAVQEIVRSYHLSFDIVPTFGLYYLDDLSLPINVMLDRAALAAKTRKGNYVETIGEYLPEMSARIKLEQDITNEMNLALETGQFQVYIQPKYSLASNMPVGGEALVRWVHPQKGMLSPGIFIPVFEKNGFVVKLDYYVWEKVCQLFRAWIDRGIVTPHPISVNVSRVNLYNPQIVDIICGLTKRYGIAPHLLQLELTESAYTENPTIMRNMVERLRREGFTVLMDDFGTGYSSLSTLKDIEVDILKIDMRFLEDSKIPGRGENIIASIIRMAKWLNIPTVAEGVEKPEQIEFLRSISCEYVQGFVYAKPMPVSAYELLVQQNREIKLDAQEVVDPDRLWSANPEMEQIFASDTQAACLYELEGETLEILRANRAFYSMFGIDAIKSGIHMLEGIVPEDQGTVVHAIQACLGTEGQAACDYHMCKGDGALLWIHLKLQAMHKIGNTHVILASLLDITAQKSTEDAKESKTLIVAGESAQELKLLRMALQDHFTVLCACDAAAVLEITQAQGATIDILLLDDSLSDEEELLLLRDAQIGGGEIPVLKIIGGAKLQRHERLLSLGASDVIGKPFTQALLLRRIEDIIRERQGLHHVKTDR